MTDETAPVPHVANCRCCQEPYVQRWVAIGTAGPLTLHDEDGNETGFDIGGATVYVGELHAPCPGTNPNT